MSAWPRECACLKRCGRGWDRTAQPWSLGGWILSWRHKPVAKVPVRAILTTPMDILIGFLTVLEVLVCILLILIVLMQRPRQEGLGAAFGSGMMDSLAGAQTTNVLQKGTTYLGVTLFAVTTLIAVIMSHRAERGADKRSFVKDTDKPVSTAPAAPFPPTPVPSLPSTPAPGKAPAAPATTKPAEATPAAPAPKATTPPASTPAPAAPAPKPAESTPAPAAPSNVIPVPTTPPVPPPAPAPAKS